MTQSGFVAGFDGGLILNCSKAAALLSTGLDRSRNAYRKARLSSAANLAPAITSLRSITGTKRST